LTEATMESRAILEMPSHHKPFEEIAVGDTAELQRTLSAELVEAFAALSGDRNPLHLDERFARERQLPKAVSHGMLLGSLVSTLVGMKLPGPGALWTQQSFRWLGPVLVGDTVRVVLRVVHKSAAERSVKVEVEATDQNGRKVMQGEGVVVMTERRPAREQQASSQETVLVTGGSRGLGAVIARAFAAGGAAVVVGYHSRADLAESLCREFSGGPGQAIPVRLDVRDAMSVDAAVGEASGKLGRPISVLVNCAGTSFLPRPFQELAWQEIEDMLEVHLRGAFNCSQAMLAGMIQSQGGVIVNIGSAFAEGAPQAGWTADVIARSALWGLTRSLAAEYGPKGIRVNMVSPGLSSTAPALQVSDRMKKVLALQTPLRRLCAPEDVAETVLFLCSAKASFLTGLDIPVCGGARM
jgi:3-oxoacyl-[acyl-carrier protein] reductase